MKLKEMQSCAADTLNYFIEVMPDVPFCADDIHIDFAPKSKMVERFKVLCKQYSPDRPISEHHEFAIENNNFGNAIIGRGQSAIVLRTDYKIAVHNLRRIVFHELMHIYCSKTEMGGEHFIDVFGSGHTPDPDPEDAEYDGYLNAGHFIWSEFIAEYTATMKTNDQKHCFSDIAEVVFSLLDEMYFRNPESKYSCAMLCAYIISCADIDNVLENFANPGFIVPDDEPDGIASMTALQSCLIYLHEHIQSEKPYKITEEFIAELGKRYVDLLLKNSILKQPEWHIGRAGT